MPTPPKRACARSTPPPALGAHEAGELQRLVLLGPPGTGKTWVTVERFLWPTLQRLGVRAPLRLLGCSFTCAAAGEIRARLAGRGLPRGVDEDDLRACVRTVHSEALRLVRAASSEEIVIQVEEERSDARLESTPCASAADPQAVALRVWDLARHLGSRDDLAQAYARIRPHGVGLREVRARIAAYEARKLEEGWLDFTDVLERALDCAPPERELVLVDEAQDSSPLQWELFERWGRAAERFVVVGDPDQAVHRWCGAWPERLLELAAEFPLRGLRQSRRVPKVPHALAVALIRRNGGRIDAPYLPADAVGRVRRTSRERAQRDLIPSEAGERTCLVLARSCQILSSYARALRRSLTPFRYERGYAPLNPGVRFEAVVSLLELRSGLAPRSWEALVPALPSCVLAPSLRAVTIAEVKIPGRRAQALARLDLKPLLTGTPLGALELLRLGPGARGYVRDLWQLVERHGPEVLEREPGIVLTTAHGAKGREADLVLVDLEAPRRVIRDLARRKESERQLLYVALTRTRDELVLIEHARRDLGRLLGLGLS